MTSIADSIWDQKYRLKAADGTPLDATLSDTFVRVARAAAGAERGGKRAKERWAETFAAAMGDMGFIPAGRILAGAGSGRSVTLFNCFVMGEIADDLGAIFEQVKEAALTMQQGGGIGHDFSTLRPKGALVASIGADASGPVSFMDVWDAMCRTIKSAGSRRGAMMATLRCDHPDIEDFIAAKADPLRLRNFNLSVLVTDAFMRAVAQDGPWDLKFGGKVYRTVPAAGLWERLMRATYDYAEPGVIFIDRVNARNNLAYCEQIAATNPCVTSDTWIHTDLGPRKVADLIGVPFVAMVDGLPYATTDAGFFKTAEKPVVRMETAEGYSVRLTSDHLVRQVVRRTRWSRELRWIQAGDLVAGDEIVLHDHRAGLEWGVADDHGLEFDEGYLLGLLIGDGTLKSDKAVLSAWQPAACAGEASNPAGATGIMQKAEAALRRLGHRDDFRGWCKVAGRSEWRMSTAALKALAERHDLCPGAKTITPAMERRSSAFTRGVLRGIFDADGSVQGAHDKGVSLRLAQSDIALLQSVQRMLLRLGIGSKIYVERREAGWSILPDGQGGSKTYPTKAQHELLISGENLVGFAMKVSFGELAKKSRMESLLGSYRRAMNREPFVARVVSVTSDGCEPVFDVSVPGCNAFDANGFYLHNCGEQPLPPYGACLLGSINLAALVERPFTAQADIDTAKLEERVRVAVRFLDDVIDVSGYPLAAQRREAKAKRRIGLGITGLADALIYCGERYGADGSLLRASGWVAAIQRAAYLASSELAAEKGAFPLFKAEPFLAAPSVAVQGSEVRAAIARHGIRNGCLTSIAPTGTISLLAGNVSSGIEPVFDFSYRRRVLQPDGAASDVRVEDAAYARFRRERGPDAPLPETFVRAGEVAPHLHLAMQAALQAHVDSSISKTVNCPADMPFAAFQDIYLDAYRLGLKGCTTYRPNPVTGEVLKPSADAAASSAGAAAPGAAGGTGGLARAEAVAVVAGDRPAALVSVEEARPQPLAGPGAPTGERGAGVVYMAKPLEREAALAGFTYKLKWPGSDHAIYVTINDIEREGRRRPFEVFINTKNLEHYAWTVALTRMISAVFRRGGDVSFVVEELKAVFDPQGGRWMEGRYVPSLLAAIGEVIEAHMVRIGFLRGEEAGEVDSQSAPRRRRRLAAPAPAAALPDADAAAGVPRRFCPRCSSPQYVRQESCWVCRDCGHSHCD